MATQNAVVLTRDLLSYTILTDKKAIIDLLNKNGVTLSQSATDSQVSVATLVASSKSPNFKSELIDLLASKTDSAKNTFQNFSGGNDMYGFTGIDDLAFTGSDDFWKNAGGISGLMAQDLGNDINKSAAQNKVNTQFKTATNNKVTTQFKTATNNKETTTKERGTFWKSIGNFLSNNVLTKDNINQGLQIGLTSINNKVQSQQNAVQQEALALQEVQDSMQRDLQKKNTPMNIWLIVGVVGGLGIIGFLIFKKK
jgi:hypothetical protein